MSPINTRPGYAEVSFIVDLPPSGGTFSITPSTDIQLFTTSVTLTASGWSDDPDDYPFEYEYAFYTDDPTKVTPLNAEQLSPT